MSNHHAMPPAPPGLSGERRQITAMFADLVGFTAISERLGEEQTYALMHVVFEAMTAAIIEQGGSVQDFTGDGVIALFGVPDAMEDGPLAACRCGLRMIEKLAVVAPSLIARYSVRPQVRIAISAGPVVVTTSFGNAATPTAVGDMVNLASRLQALAEPGTVVLSEHAFALVDGFVEATFAGAHAIRGKTDPQKVWRLEAVREGATRFGVALRQGLTAYIGRERELDSLQASLAAARAGLRVVDVVAEPGMGKSRLLHEFRRGITDSGVLVLIGNCSPIGRRTAFLPFIEIVREWSHVRAGEAEDEIQQKLSTSLAYFGLDTAENAGLLLNLLGLAPGAGALAGLDGVLVGLHTRDLLRRMVRVACDRAQTVLMIEDLHWIDSASQELLDDILAHAAGLPLLVIHTRRPEYEPTWRAAPQVKTLALERLSADSMRGLIQTRMQVDAAPEALVRHVTHRADGNALFAEEILSLLSQSGALRKDGGGVAFDPSAAASALPASLQGLLSARVDRLAPVDRTLLQGAAAIGRYFDPTLLAAVAGDEVGAEARLERMVALDLVHPDGASGGYSFKHALVRDMVYQSLLTTTRSALHLRIAEEIERRSSNRLTEVAESLAHHYGQTHHTVKAFTYLTLAGAKSLGVYSLDEADQHFSAATELVEKDPSCASDAELAGMLANFALCANISLKLDRILEIGTRFRSRLQRLGDSEQRMLIQYHYVQTLLWSSRFKEAQEWQRDLAAMADRLANSRSRAYAMVTEILVSTHVAPKPAEIVRADTAEALAATESVDDPYLHFNLLAAAGWDELNRGRILEARRAADGMLAAGRRINDPRSMGYALSLKALIALMHDDYPATLQFADEAIAISRVPFDRETASSARNAALVLLRRPEAMASVRAFMDTCARNGWHLLYSGVDDLWGVALMLGGDVSGGLRYMEDAILRREAEGYRGSADWTRMFLSEIYLQLLVGGRKASARLLLTNLPTLVRIRLTASRRIAALVAEVRSNPQFDPNGIFVARCEMILGLLCKARSRRADAIRHLSEAKRITSQFGPSPILVRVEGALAELSS